jgi:hypothetical protein
VLLDAFSAAAIETAFDTGARGGFKHAHPMLDGDLVALVRGLPVEALVRGGEPKSPARAYLRDRVPSITGAWPRPSMAGDMLAELMRQRHAYADARGSAALAELGLRPPPPGAEGGSSMALAWLTLSTGQWLHAVLHGGTSMEASVAAIATTRSWEPMRLRRVGDVRLVPEKSYR